MSEDFVVVVQLAQLASKARGKNKMGLKMTRSSETGTLMDGRSTFRASYYAGD